MRHGAAAALAAAALALSAGCTAAVDQPAAPGPPSAGPPVFLVLDADPHGAIVLNGARDRYEGVARGSGPVWDDAAAVRAGSMVSCLARCPDVVFSSGTASLNSPGASDPVPQVVIGGRPRTWPVGHTPKRTVLSARGLDDYVLSAGGPTTGWWLELHAPGRPVARIDVGGARTSWQPSADGRHALAITVVPGGRNEARWFDRHRDTWRPAATARVAGFVACVAPDGGRALLLGQRPALLDRTGAQHPITDLVSGGACAFAAAGGLVAELAASPRGRTTRLRAFGADGRPLWGRDLAGEASVTADRTAARVAYVHDGRLYEVDLARGADLRRVPDVAAARYDGAGTLVVVGPDGTVRWLPP